MYFRVYDELNCDHNHLPVVLVYMMTTHPIKGTFLVSIFEDYGQTIAIILRLHRFLKFIFFQKSRKLVI